MDKATVSLWMTWEDHGLTLDATLFAFVGCLLGAAALNSKIFRLLRPATKTLPCPIEKSVNDFFLCWQEGRVFENVTLT